MTGVQTCALPISRGGAPPYSDAESTAVYERVAIALSGALDAGLTPIADGAFLERRRRAEVRELAARRERPLVIVSTVAPETVLRTRITDRLAHHQDPSEADLAVLAKQLATAEALDDRERHDAVVCGPETQPCDVAASVSGRFARS